MGIALSLLRAVLGSRIGRIAFLSLAIMAGLGIAAWRIDARAYDRGVAAQLAADTAATAALQSSLDAVTSAAAKTASDLAVQQINNATILGSFTNAIPLTACAPDAASLRSLHSLWSTARGKH